jgi:hypothetical protein
VRRCGLGSTWGWATIGAIAYWTGLAAAGAVAVLAARARLVVHERQRKHAEANVASNTTPNPRLRSAPV